MTATETLPLTKTTPFKHQAQVIEDTKDARYFGLFMEQGTGKSHVIIATMTHLYRTGKINGVLILAPNGVHDNWARNEIPIHCPLVPNEDIITGIWHGGDGVRKRQRWRIRGRVFDHESTARRPHGQYRGRPNGRLHEVDQILVQQPPVPARH